MIRDNYISHLGRADAESYVCANWRYRASQPPTMRNAQVPYVVMRSGLVRDGSEIASGHSVDERACCAHLVTCICTALCFWRVRCGRGGQPICPGGVLLSLPALWYMSLYFVSKVHVLYTLCCVFIPGAQAARTSSTTMNTAATI